MMKAIRTSQKGFTLIEVIVTIALVSIALLSNVGLCVTAIKGNTSSRMSTQATVLAKDKLESLKNDGFASAASGGPEVVQNSFTRQWVVADTVQGGVTVAGSRTATVTVSWSTYGQVHSVAFTTFINE